MSIFYDPRQQRPQPWVFIFFMVLMVLVAYFIYAYGDHKARNMPSEETQSNSIFEKATD